MALDLTALIEARRSETSTLFERHLNSQLVHVLRTLGFDVDYVRGEGPYLFDARGTRYLDLLSGFGVFTMGRNHPTVIGALRQALEARLASLVQFDVPLLAGLLAEGLLKRMPWLEKVFFCNSGAEAVEAAIKFSRVATGRSMIVCCEHAFHGLTYGALSLTADELFREGFGPLLADCVHIPFNDLEALEHALARREIAAFVVEPIQGKGVNIPDDGYLPEAARLCQKYGTLLVADEIQCGMGRTGRFLACEHWAVEPDVVLLAKSLSGGFVPVGALATRRWVHDKVFDRMDHAVVHGSTFARNDMAMAAGLATLTVLDEERLIERAERLGARLIQGLRQRLDRTEFVAEVRGKGMMVAIEFGQPESLKLKAAYALLEKVRPGLFCQLILIPLLKQHHILAQVAGHDLPVIKLLPSLVLDEADIAWIENAFEQVVRDARKLGGIWTLGRALASQAIEAQASHRASGAGAAA
jgi:ornithine--oxo-acid transaminase